MEFTEGEAKAKEPKEQDEGWKKYVHVKVCDDKLSTKKGTKIKKGAKGRVVEVHPLHRLNPKTKEEVWAVNVEIDPPHAKPDDNLIEDIRKADYKRSLEETDFI